MLYEPTAQVGHVDAPAALNVPAGQSLQDDAPGVLYFPARQNAHSALPRPEQLVPPQIPKPQEWQQPQYKEFELR